MWYSNHMSTTLDAIDRRDIRFTLQRMTPVQRKTAKAAIRRMYKEHSYLMSIVGEERTKAMCIRKVMTPYVFGVMFGGK